ncbi:MAG: hypothetical protein J5I90_22575 [Caldilineales bacterium]|nr:hypothetical protein [Caldilineales bacterium]
MSNNSYTTVFASGFEIIDEIQFQKTRVDGMEWSPDGTILAMYEKWESYLFWNIDQKSIDYRFINAAPNGISWSSDCTMMAISTIDGIQIHDLSQESSPRNPELIVNQLNRWDESHGLHGKVEGMAWLLDNKSVLILNSGGRLLMWDIYSGEVQQIHVLNGGHTPLNLALSPTKSLAALNIRSMPIQIIDLETNIVLSQLDGHFGPISYLDWSSDERYLAAGSWDNSVYIWDLVDECLVTRLDEAHDRVFCVRFSNDGKVLAAVSEDNVIRVWRCHDWEQVAQVPEFTGGLRGGVAFHPFNPIMAAGSDGGAKIRLWKYRH